MVTFWRQPDMTLDRHTLFSHSSHLAENGCSEMIEECVPGKNMASNRVQKDSDYLTSANDAIEAYHLSVGGVFKLVVVIVTPQD